MIAKIRLCVVCGSPLFVLGSILSLAGCSRKFPNETPSQRADSNTVDVHGQTGMIAVQGGQFQMGLQEGNPGRPERVNSFSMDRMEVTVASYSQCVIAGRCTPAARNWNACNWGRSERSEHPINCVTWEQARTFCTWAGKRLPTEKEWEFGARGTDGRTYPWGVLKPDSRTCSGKERTGTCPAGSVEDVSPFGLLDMAGNVKEWTSTREELPGGVAAFVIRGGGWEFDGLTREIPVRVTERDTLPPAEMASDLGFRCASDAQPR
jgi:formylglycine-generating enzyme required for sulfatase activity